MLVSGQNKNHFSISEREVKEFVRLVIFQSRVYFERKVVNSAKAMDPVKSKYNVFV